MAIAKINGSKYKVKKSFKLDKGLIYIDDQLIGESNPESLNLILENNEININK